MGSCTLSWLALAQCPALLAGDLFSWPSPNVQQLAGICEGVDESVATGFNECQYCFLFLFVSVIGRGMSVTGVCVSLFV